MFDTGSGVHEWSQPGLWTLSASAFVLQQPSWRWRQSRVLCAAGPAGALGSGQALGTPALVLGLRGGVGIPAADPSQPPLFWDCHDTKDLERCGILSAAFRPVRPTW